MRVMFPSPYLGLSLKLKMLGIDYGVSVVSVPLFGAISEIENVRY